MQRAAGKQVELEEVAAPFAARLNGKRIGDPSSSRRCLTSLRYMFNFPLLVLKGIYHYWKSMFFQGS